MADKEKITPQQAEEIERNIEPVAEENKPRS